MKAKASNLVFAVSCAVALLMVVATFWWISGLLMDAYPHTAAEEEAHETAGWNVVAFIYLVAPALSGVSLFCAMMSGVSFLRHRRRWDLWSFCLSVITLLSLAGQVIYLWFAR
jgi:hypothetical protein